MLRKLFRRPKRG